MSQDQQEEEDKFINPEKYEKMQEEWNEEVAKLKLEIQNEERAKKEYIDFFKRDEWTIHKEIPPAKDRIDLFHRWSMP